MYVHFVSYHRDDPPNVLRNGEVMFSYRILKIIIFMHFNSRKFCVTEVIDK